MTTQTPRKRRPQPITLPSDDCELTYGGEEFYPHDGETVTFIPGLTVAGLLQLTQLAKLAPRFEALDPSTPPAESTALMAEFGDIVREMAVEVAPKIVGWTWTDEAGDPLPPPREHPAVLHRLEIKELMYLGLLLRGEGEAQQRKG